MNTPAGDSELLPLIRQKVRERLTQSQAFRALSPEQRQAVARDTVSAFHYILGGADGNSRPDSVTLGGNALVGEALADKRNLPEGDTAGQRFAESGAVAAQQGSEAFTDMIQKVDFPAFVAGLIDGVFNAIVNSSIKQMEAYAELVSNVAKSVDQYMRDNVTENNARDYLLERYPDFLDLDLSGDKPRVKPRQGHDENSLPDFQGDLGLGEAVASLDDETVEEKLVPAARRRIAMDRQQLLATMVMMGVNRLVVTQGTIEASCLFELKTTDAVKRRYQRKSTADWHSQSRSGMGAYGSSSSSGFLGLGAKRRGGWYAYASDDQSANFSVSTNRSEDSEAKVQMNAKLAGKVNVQFKSDYFPMERMVDVMQIDRIRAKAPAGGQPANPADAVPPPGQKGK